MIIKPHIREAINSLSGITYAEWKIIKIVIDGCFEQKEKEFEKTLELPTEIVADVIRSRFGEKPSPEVRIFTNGKLTDIITIENGEVVEKVIPETQQ